MVHRRVASTCLCEHARAHLPLIEAVRFAQSLRKLAQTRDLQKNMDQCRDNAAPTINGQRMLKWYSSHPLRILICPIMHIRKKHMTQK